MKRSLHTEGHGVPVGAVINGANVHDKRLLEETIDARVFAPPPELWTRAQHLCLDKGYDYPDTRERVAELGFVPHIRSRGEEKHAKKNVPGYRARRWVNERAHSWINRFRRLLIRWEKKPENYLAFLQLACAVIAIRSCRTLAKEVSG